MSGRDAQSIRLVALASLIGTTIEWYDFFLYGTAAALVFNRLYFPTFDPLTRDAGRVWHLQRRLRRAADRRHRHRPLRRPRRTQVDARADADDHGHRDVRHRPAADLRADRTVGGRSRWCVLRLAQGFGVGGEWGGAVLMAVEHAPPARADSTAAGRRSACRPGCCCPRRCSRMVARLPEEQFLAWGWRVPFLLSILLVGRRPGHPPADHGNAGVRARQGGARRGAAADRRASCRRIGRRCCWRWARGSRRTAGSTSTPSSCSSTARSTSAFAGRRCSTACSSARRLLLVADPAVRRAVGSARPPAGLSVRRVLHGAVRVPAVLAARHRDRRRWCGSRSCVRARLRARADVRAAGGVLLGAVRHARPLQRRLARIAARRR